LNSSAWLSEPSRSMSLSAHDEAPGIFPGLQ
jgi:hypothetical protein